MNKIKKLPQNVINLIAAGEVVERPSSVIKELLENSIDAGSTNIVVNIENFGEVLIQVADNGTGMTKEDAILSLEQHATSKLSDINDLESLATYGFRGEALASIASVSEKVLLETKTAGNDAVLLTQEDAEIKTNKSSKSDIGTTISIYNLFAKVPARKKFLKTQKTELKSLYQTFLNTALINLGIHFELYHNKQLIYRLPRSTSLSERVLEAFGTDTAKNIYEFSQTNHSKYNIGGALGKPEIAKKSTNTQMLYINGRFVYDKTIIAAVNQAYEGFIHRDLRPFWILDIHIDPSEVDVNVHPRKHEVKFEDNQSVFRAVYSVVRNILETKTKQDITDRFSSTTEKPDFVDNVDKIPNYIPKPRPSSVYIPKRNDYKINKAIDFTKEILRDSDTLFSTQPLANDEKTEAKPQKYTQIFNTYILCEVDNKILFIDQHAAAEKILFEKLLTQYKDVKTKPLLVPQIIDLKAYEKEEILALKEELKNIGVEIADFGSTSIQVTEVPEILNKFNIDDFIKLLLEGEDDYVKGYKNFNSNDISLKIYMLLATTACHGSIRAGQVLSEVEMQQIVLDLLKLENPYNCPHGRPTMWELTRADLEKNFKRII